MLFNFYENFYGWSIWFLLDNIEVNSLIHLLLICTGIFADVDNYERLKVVLVNFPILNNIYEPIRIVYISNILVHVQIKCIPKYYLI
jgi:hypothetical protein